MKNSSHLGLAVGLCLLVSDLRADLQRNDWAAVWLQSSNSHCMSLMYSGKREDDPAELKKIGNTLYPQVFISWAIARRGMMPDILVGKKRLLPHQWVEGKVFQKYRVEERVKESPLFFIVPEMKTPGTEIPEGVWKELFGTRRQYDDLAGRFKEELFDPK